MNPVHKALQRKEHGKNSEHRAVGTGGKSQESRGRRRIRAIDLARGMSIVLVVLGHTPLPEWLNGPLSTFRLPLLFLLSGYLFNFVKYRDDARTLVQRRFWRLLVPYFTAGLVSYLIWLLSGRPAAPAQEPVPWYRPLLGLLYGSSTGDWLAHNLPLWFLPASFCASLVFWALLKAAAARPPAAQAAVFALAGGIGAAIGRHVALPWGLDIALVAQPFLWAGHRLREAGWLGRRPALPAPAWLAGAALYVLAVAGNGLVAMNARAYGNLALFYAGGLGGALVVLRLAQALTAWPAADRVLAYLGRHSLVILAFHVGLAFPVLAFLGQALLGDPFLEVWWLYWLWGVAFPALLAAAIDRHPLLRLLFAGERPLASQGRVRGMARAAPPESRPATAGRGTSRRTAAGRTAAGRPMKTGHLAL